MPAGTGLVKLGVELKTNEEFKTDEKIDVTHLNRKICVHAHTTDLWCKSLYTGKSPNKIKSYVIFRMIWKVVSIFWKKLLLPWKIFHFLSYIINNQNKCFRFPL